MKVFDATVTATMLYGCAPWALAKDLESKIQRAQRNMFRMMIRSGRRVYTENENEQSLEPWVDWIERTTHQAETIMAQSGIRGWIEGHRNAKQRWHIELVANRKNTWA